MPWKTLVEVAKSTIMMEEKMTVRKKNIARYCQDFAKNQKNLMKKKNKDQRINKQKITQTIRRCVYYQNCYNEWHLIKECKLLNKFCQICKHNDHNT